MTVTNLVSNAIKYTEKGGAVKVYISYLVDDVFVKVADTGFGIDKEHLPRIFNRFYRVDMTGSRMFGGTGLGLSIARELVELHNGKISVTSTLGKGTEFTVMIPIARKVMQDTLNACRQNCPPVDPLHLAAAEELRAMAREMDFADKDFAQLEKKQVARLLDRILERDQADESVTLGDTKAYKVLREEDLAEQEDETQELTKTVQNTQPV